jgi:diaminohydroxyphosphoribosylaminopyrimidine deaminase/5-amino-6-(5-phosphoribosylamino)uracil reductase
VHAGAEVLVLPTEDDRVSLPALWQELGARGLQSLLLEGGPTLAMAALQARLIDRVRLYLAPKLLGGDDGVPLFRGVGPQRMADAILLTHRLLRVAGEDVVIEGDLPCLLD